MQRLMQEIKAAGSLARFFQILVGTSLCSGGALFDEQWRVLDRTVYSVQYLRVQIDTVGMLRLLHWR